MNFSALSPRANETLGAKVCTVATSEPLLCSLFVCHTIAPTDARFRRCILCRSDSIAFLLFVSFAGPGIGRRATAARARARERPTPKE
jgi:hypothetical protein